MAWGESGMHSPSEPLKWDPGPWKPKCVFSAVSKFHDYLLKVPKESRNDVLWGWCGEGERERTRQAKKDWSRPGERSRQDIRTATCPSGPVGQLNTAFWLNCSILEEKKRLHLLIQETRPHSLSTDCSWAWNRAEGTVKFHVKALDTEDPPWLSQVYIYDAHDWLLCLKKTYGFKWIQLGVSTLENMGFFQERDFYFRWLFKDIATTRWGNKKITLTFL